jgi:hypothetical protein
MPVRYLKRSIIVIKSIPILETLQSYFTQIYITCQPLGIGGIIRRSNLIMTGKFNANINGQRKKEVRALRKQ